MHVSHQFENGETLIYDAILRFPIEGSSHSVLERVRQFNLRAVDACRQLFLAAEDLPIAGVRDWFMISDFPVELSRHTTGRCNTRLVMDLLGYTPS